MTVELLKVWIALGASLGVFAAIGATARWYWNRSRWRHFEEMIRTWAIGEAFSLDLSKDEWRSLVAIKMWEAGFSPAEVLQFLEFAVIFAKGSASLEFQGRIEFTSDQEEEHGGRADNGTKGEDS